MYTPCQRLRTAHCGVSFLSRFIFAGAFQVPFSGLNRKAFIAVLLRVRGKRKMMCANACIVLESSYTKGCSRHYSECPHEQLKRQRRGHVVGEWGPARIRRGPWKTLAATNDHPPLALAWERLVRLHCSLIVYTRGNPRQPAGNRRHINFEKPLSAGVENALFCE